MRPFQTGDIVRDSSLDEMLPEYQREQMRFRVISIAHAVDELTPAIVRIDGEWVQQQFLTLEREDGLPHFRAMCAQEAFTHRGPRYEVVKSVEEVVAEEFMA